MNLYKLTLACLISSLIIEVSINALGLKKQLQEKKGINALIIFVSSLIV